MINNLYFLLDVHDHEEGGVPSNETISDGGHGHWKKQKQNKNKNKTKQNKNKNKRSQTYQTNKAILFDNSFKCAKICFDKLNKFGSFLKMNTCLIVFLMVGC